MGWIRTEGTGGASTAASGGELAAKKAMSNRGRSSGSGPDHPPKKVELAKSSIMGMLAGIKAIRNDNNIMGDLAYRKRK